MRSLTLVSLVLAFLAVPVFAQQGGQQRQRPPGFQDEELKKLSTLEQKIRAAFEADDYATALPHLAEQITIMEKVIERFAKTEMDSEEKEEAKKGWIGSYKKQTAGMIYNQACCYSMTGKKAEAVAALKKSIDLGYLEIEHMKQDEDLDPIRESAEYKALIAGLSYNEVYEVYKPESLGEEAPKAILVALHRVGQKGGIETDDLDSWKTVADKTKVLLIAPRGPVFMGPGKYGWQKTSDDEEAAFKKIRFSIEDVRKKHSLGELPVYLLGIDQGGKYATLGALKMPKLVKGAIQINTYWNKYYLEEFLPAAKKAGTKICLMCGKEHSYYAKATTAMEQMKGEGVASKLIVFEGKDVPENIADKVKEGVVWLMGG